jgi:YidC/Oxa1 family membrane protein insertase
MRRPACIITLLLLFACEPLFANSGIENAADIRVTTRYLQLGFSYNGELTSATACFPDCTGSESKQGRFSTGGGLLAFDAAGGGTWTLDEKLTDHEQILVFREASGKWISWYVPHEGYLLKLEAGGAGKLSLGSRESFRPRPAAGFGNWLEQLRYVSVSSDGVNQAGLDEVDVGSITTDGWIGYRNRYWAAMLSVAAEREVGIETGEERQDATLILTADADAYRHLLYLGPVEPRILRSTAPELADILYAGLWFWLRWICFALFYLLSWIHALIPSWGLAVMALSVAVGILMLPLSRIADRLQQQVNETESLLAPELESIKREHKGEEQASRILELYRREGVHPLYSLKSMMGVAVVIPVFIGAFDMLAENIHLMNASFLWITDLSRPDGITSLPFELPFFGADLNLMPFLMTGLSVAASALHKPLALNAQLRRKQLRNMLLLAVAFFVLFYTFPAGMVLYWTTNNLISVTKGIWHHRYNSSE